MSNTTNFIFHAVSFFLSFMAYVVFIRKRFFVINVKYHNDKQKRDRRKMLFTFLGFFVALVFTVVIELIFLFGYLLFTVWSSILSP